MIVFLLSCNSWERREETHFEITWKQVKSKEHSKGKSQMCGLDHMQISDSISALKAYFVFSQATNFPKIQTYFK